MLKMNLLSACMVALGLAVGVIGCGGSSSPSASPRSDAKGQGKVDEEAAKIDAALAKLSAEDRAAVEKQEICPVGGGPLGGMDTPIAVDVGEGRIVWICCEGCRETLLEDVEGNLAILAKHKEKSE